MNLYSQYKRILSDSQLWNINQRNPEIPDLDTLFQRPHVFNFIKLYMFHTGDMCLLPWGEINKNSELFDERASHTVSLFLLGILCSDLLELDDDRIPKYDEDSKKNFLYIWSLMSLYHDIGYLYEMKNGLLELCPTIKKLVEYLKIENNLLDSLEDRSLFESYYAYRIKKFKVIDHGIVAAILLYDRMIRDIEKQKELHKKCKLYIGDERRFSDKRRESAQVISYIILQHNMWFASDDMIEEYCREGLIRLTPKLDQSHRYTIDGDQLLFFICLLDTIEPIKREEKLGLSKYELLKAIDIDISTKDRKVCIYINDDRFNDEFYFKLLKDLESWIQVSIRRDKVNTISIEIISLSNKVGLSF